MTIQYKCKKKETTAEEVRAYQSPNSHGFGRVYRESFDPSLARKDWHVFFIYSKYNE
jgi:hypothetical protein